MRSARRRYEEEVAHARKFIEMLPPGTHQFTSKGAGQGYNFEIESANWYFAIGGYLSWGRGSAVVKEDAQGRAYSVEFEYRFYDRYNWEAGKSVTIMGIEVTDQFMGEFHREGLAREFDCSGSFKRHLAWTQGSELAMTQLYPAGGR